MKRATAAAGEVIHQSLFIVQEFIPKCETTFVGRERDFPILCPLLPSLQTADAVLEVPRSEFK